MRKLFTLFSLTSCLLLVSINLFAAELKTYGPTSTSDQLWQIAQKVRPSAEVSKQQTMMAILKANPRAFASNNVNGLRAGYTLTIPSLDQIKAIPALSALIQISAQNSAWLNRVEFNTQQNSKSEASTQTAYTRFVGKPEIAEQPLVSLMGLETPEKSAQTVINALFHEMAQQSIEGSDPVKTLTPLAINAVTAEKMIKNGIATHIGQLTQRFEDFLIRFNQLEKETAQKLQLISEDHRSMKNQIASLDKQVQQLRENYLNLAAPIHQKAVWNNAGLWILGSSIVACLIALIFTTSRRREVSIQVKENPTVSLKDTIEAIEDEYDYMGSQEGISAKLDLARAYIDMGDITQASQILNDVISHGNHEQRLMAEKILSEITRDTVH